MGALISKITKKLKKCNHIFKQLQTQLDRAKHEDWDEDQIIFKSEPDKKKRKVDGDYSSFPKNVIQVAAVIPDDQYQHVPGENKNDASTRDVILNLHNGEIKRIDSKHQLYEPIVTTTIVFVQRFDLHF